MSDQFVGQIKMFAGNFAPRQFAFCSGALLQVAQNTALFSIVGTIYGGDGRTTFGLPDLRSRAPMHWGSGPGLTPRKIGQKVGEETETLNETQIPAHNHPLVAQPAAPDSNLPAATRSLGGATVYTAAATADQTLAPSAVEPAGGNQRHPNQQPFLTINFIIALTGTFPSRN